MKKWYMVIDPALCNDCNCCFMADKDEFTGNDWPPFSKAQPWEGQRWINIERKERGQFPQIQVVSLPTVCMHCDDAPCMKVAPADAVYKRDDGLVVIDPEKAKGHREIVESCPYGAIYWNEEEQLAQKCTGCAHLMDDGWTQTRCQQGCPTGALQAGLVEEEEMAKRIKDEALEVYHGELGSEPRVYYKNLHLFTRAFVAGTAVFDDTGECAEGVTVAVKKGDSPAGECVTNNFGDYLIDKLEPGRYSVVMTAPGYQSVTQEVTVAPESTTIAPIFLRRV